MPCSARGLALGMLLSAAIATTPGATSARAACRQALALGLDVSGSVDAREYRLQLDGLAAALDHPDVRAALFASPLSPVRLSIFEWSGPNHQHVILPWTSIDGDDDLDRVIGRLHRSKRSRGGHSTAIGAALEFGFALLHQQSDCPRHTLDISGDGKSNSGPPPEQVALVDGPSAPTVNALVIGVESGIATPLTGTGIAELSSYFRARVIRGPDAFVQTALGFHDFQSSMKRKLLRELGGFVLGGLQSLPTRPRVPAADSMFQ